MRPLLFGCPLNSVSGVDLAGGRRMPDSEAVASSSSVHGGGQAARRDQGEPRAPLVGVKRRSVSECGAPPACVAPPMVKRATRSTGPVASRNAAALQGLKEKVRFAAHPDSGPHAAFETTLHCAALYLADDVVARRVSECGAPPRLSRPARAFPSARKARPLTHHGLAFQTLSAAMGWEASSSEDEFAHDLTGAAAGLLSL